MQKTYVLDANVLLQAPYALESFEDNHIVLPLAVLEELDALKGADGEAGNNARQALRFLEDLRLRGDLVKSVILPSGGTVRLEVNHVDAALPQGIEPGSWAGRVLKVCRGLMDEGTPVTLVSRDMVARIRAQMMGVPAEDFTTDRLPDGAQPYTGRAEVYIPDALLPAFKKKGVPVGELYAVDGAGERKPVSLTENQFVLLHSDTEPKKTMLGRFREGKVAALRFGGVRPFGVKPRSVGQQFLQEALLLPAEEAPLAIIQGPAGTAKTFYALAAGLEQVLEAEERPYRKILVCRPNAQFDAERNGPTARFWCAAPTPSLTRTSASSRAVSRKRSPPSCGLSWTIWRSCWIWRERKRSVVARRSCGVALTTSSTPVSSPPRP